MKQNRLKSPVAWSALAALIFFVVRNIGRALGSLMFDQFITLTISRQRWLSESLKQFPNQKIRFLNKTASRKGAAPTLFIKCQARHQCWALAILEQPLLSSCLACLFRTSPILAVRVVPVKPLTGLKGYSRFFAGGF